jgi:predicted DNA-binding transcriptional regulator YafY
VHAPAAEVADRIPPTAGLVEAIDPQTSRLYAGANDLDWLAAHIGALGLEVEVIDPPELVDRIRAMAGRLHRAAGDRP